MLDLDQGVAGSSLDTEALCCVLEQDILSSARLSTGSTQNTANHREVLWFSDKVLNLRGKGLLAQSSPEALCCVLEQDI